MSDRGLRRLFDRLTGLGAAGEPPGQPFASTGSDDDSRGDTDESRQKHGQRMRSEDRLFDPDWITCRRRCAGADLPLSFSSI